MAISTSCEQIAHLSSIKGLGLKTFYHLYQHFGNVEGIIRADYDNLTRVGLKPAIARSLAKLGETLLAGKASHTVEKQFEWSEQDRNYVLSIEDPFYPAILKEVYCPPPIIYIKGCVRSLSLPSLAVVGSRKPSIAGKQHAFSFSRDISFQGFNIVSGLALGIDTQAHQGALEASGITCAVLGTGLDVIYPKQNQKLADQIVEKGALVSEMALGSMPVPANFPRRNRLISGLSQGVLVVEAGLKSGSLITASYAIEQNREVYVIPGPIDSDVAAGCNDLIKQGAQLVTCVDDVLGGPAIGTSNHIEFVPSASNSQLSDAGGSDKKQCEPSSAEPISKFDLGKDEVKVLTLLGYQCTSFDLLVSESRLEAAIVLQSLVSLEIKGLISNVPGGYQRVK